jgi:RNA polymerase sigma-70 factor (ECF subfamily)
MKVIQLHKNESKLIDKAVKNDRKAQHTIYELYASKMLSVCRYYIKDIVLAEEVMLNGFFKVFKYLSSFKKEGSFEGWIRKIMVRECISELRKKDTLEFTTDDLEVHDNFHDHINSNIAVNEIQETIDELPEGYKLVFMMYAIEGYKHQEISEILGISVGTSKSQLFKARQILQEKIKKLNQSNYGSN